MEQSAKSTERFKPPVQIITDLKTIAAKTGDLPPLPAIAMRAIEMTSDPKVSAQALQGVISRDQALTARILRIVNSPMYYLQREISTLSHALSILGLEAVRSILMAVSVQQLFQKGAMRGHDLATKLLSDHSWGAAIAARSIALRIRYENPEEAFLSGLLHDIGKLVLAQNMQKQYTKIVSEVYKSKITFHDAELESFGFSHAHVGAILAAKWNFPQQLAESILHHHNPTAAPVHPKLTCIVNLANLMMVFMEVGFEKNNTLELSKADAAEFLRLDKTALENLVSEVRTKSEGGHPL